MTITRQTCSLSALHTGRSIYFGQRISAAMAEYFPLSSDNPGFEYKAEFDDVKQELRIFKDLP